MLKLAIAILGGYSLIVAAVYLMQGRMLYLPNMPGRTLEVSPADAGMEYDDVWLETSDGVRLHGWFVTGPGQSDRVLLFFHGNAGNISHRLESIRQFLELGLSVMIIDYRGYGQSGGSISEAGIYRDADAAWNYLSEVQGATEIVVFGRSLGASVAAWLAAKRRPSALIVESSFTSVPDIAQELYPWLPARRLSRLQHATRDYIAEVLCPVLVVHSRNDEIIPFHHGEAIFAAASEPRFLLELEGTHNDAFIRDEQVYLDGLRKFLSTLAPRAVQ